MAVCMDVSCFSSRCKHSKVIHRSGKLQGTVRIEGVRVIGTQLRSLNQVSWIRRESSGAEGFASNCIAALKVL